MLKNSKRDGWNSCFTEYERQKKNLGVEGLERRVVFSVNASIGSSAVSFMKIGEVAKRSDVGIETIRYYEREGLLAEPERKASGYRQYDESVVKRLKFIRNSKELGFTLAEIKELLALWFDPNTRCQHVRQRAELKIVDIEEKVRSLQKMKRSLKRIISQCETKESVDKCPLWLELDETRNNNDAGKTK
jgi:Hg(II)-responsive transcriptional regulator